MPRILSEADGARPAFRCKTCGKLHSSDYAGESPVPTACCVCRAGVVMRHQTLAAELRAAIEAGDKEKSLHFANEVAKCHPTSKDLDPDNWEVLADCTAERLKELAIEGPVVAHKMWTKPEGTPDRPPVAHSVSVGENPAAKDKV